ncbi:MAG: hypothetical protein Kow0026_23090 [Oricola sp.]
MCAKHKGPKANPAVFKAKFAPETQSRRLFGSRAALAASVRAAVPWRNEAKKSDTHRPKVRKGEEEWRARLTPE